MDKSCIPCQKPSLNRYPSDRNNINDLKIRSSEQCKLSMLIATGRKFISKEIRHNDFKYISL